MQRVASHCTSNHFHRRAKLQKGKPHDGHRGHAKGHHDSPESPDAFIQRTFGAAHSHSARSADSESDSDSTYSTSSSGSDSESENSTDSSPQEYKTNAWASDKLIISYWLCTTTADRHVCQLRVSKS